MASEVDELETPRTPMRRLGSTRKLAAFATDYLDIRGQLGEQARLVEARAEGAAGAAAELADYCRRRSELEHEYARALDKLARAAAARRAALEAKRAHVAAAPAAACWLAAADGARELARAHHALAAAYGGALAARLARAADDAARLHARCREVLAERQEEVVAALGEAGAAGKAHAGAAAAHRAAALKLRHAYDARERAAASDPPSQRKLKALDKQLDKRRARHTAARGRALRAHADFVLSVAAARAALQRYYVDDVGEILACMETGWEAVLRRVMDGAAGAEAAAGAAAAAAAAGLAAAGAAQHAGSARAAWLAAHAAAFTPPPVAAPPAAAPAHEELLGAAAPEPDAAFPAESRARLLRLRGALRDLRAAARETHKTLRAAEAELVRQMEGGESQWELAALCAGAAPEREPAREQQEDYYLAKFRAYLALAGRVARLEAREAALRRDAGAGDAGDGDAEAGDAAGDGDDDDDVPRVVRACVRAIAAHGLRQQGVFRVPGSAGEAAALRAALARGEAARVRGAPDVHAVCSLLKAALRASPLLAGAARARLLALAAGSDCAASRAALAAELARLPRRALLTLRYVCAFLAHLAAHARHNLMDAWNLAVCVGPTLLAAAHVGQQHAANELVKRLIVHHAALFPQHVAPHALYRPEEMTAENGDAAADTDAADGAAPDAALDPSPDASLDPSLDASLDPSLHAALDASLDDTSLYEPHDESDDDTEDASDAEEEDWRDEHPQRATPARRDSNSQEDPSAFSSSSVNTCTRLAEATPDLVLDLPPRAAVPAAPLAAACPPPPAAPLPAAPLPAAADAPRAAPPTPPPRDAADHFALNRDTLKKRPTSKSSESEDSSAAGPTPAATGATAATDTVDAAAGAAGAAGGSPVAARNTARMAAKFADLALTGGARKPSVAAKPALLRRPTPHPQHAAPAAPATPPVGDPERPA